MTLQVLVVDDESLARARLRTLLGDCTAPAANVGGEAANATQAMELLRRQPFDAVLLDIRMPGADGLALAQAMRTLEQPPAVIFVTAHAEHAVEAFELAAEERIVQILVRLKMVSSGAEARRLIEQNGVRLDGQPVTDQFASVKPDVLPVVLQVGKRKFVRLVPAT